LAIQDQIGDAVKAAVSDGVSVLSWLSGFGNMDDQIGSAVFRFSHKQLEEAGNVRIPFGRRWDNEGDWEIFGGITATIMPRRVDPCCSELRRKVKALESAVATLQLHDKRRRIREATQPTSTVTVAGRPSKTVAASRAPR
jgi:hypothetical protein